MIAIDGERPCSWPRWLYQWYRGELEVPRPRTIDQGPGSGTRLVPTVKLRLTQLLQFHLGVRDLTIFAAEIVEQVPIASHNVQVVQMHRGPG